MKRTRFYGASIGLGVVLGLMLAAIEYYPARELAAAFVIFTILAAMIGAPLLLLVALEEVTVEWLPRLSLRPAPVVARNNTAFVAPRRFR